MCRLESSYFQAEIIQCLSLQVVQLFSLSRYCWEHCAWDSEAFAIDEVGRRGADVRFESGSKGEKAAGESPEPVFSCVAPKSLERFLKAPMHSFY